MGRNEIQDKNKQESGDRNQLEDGPNSCPIFLSTKRNPKSVASSSVKKPCPHKEEGTELVSVQA